MEELSKTPSLQRGAATRCVSCRKRFAQDEQTFQLTIDRSRKESTVQFDHDTVCADCFKKAEALSMENKKEQIEEPRRTASPRLIPVLNEFHDESMPLLKPKKSIWEEIVRFRNYFGGTRMVFCITSIAAVFLTLIAIMLLTLGLEDNFQVKEYMCVSVYPVGVDCHVQKHCFSTTSRSGTVFYNCFQGVFNVSTSESWEIVNVTDIITGDIDDIELCRYTEPFHCWGWKTNELRMRIPCFVKAQCDGTYTLIGFLFTFIFWSIAIAILCECVVRMAVPWLKNKPLMGGISVRYIRHGIVLPSIVGVCILFSILLYHDYLADPDDTIFPYVFSEIQYPSIAMSVISFTLGCYIFYWHAFFYRFRYLESFIDCETGKDKLFYLAEQHPYKVSLVRPLKVEVLKTSEMDMSEPDYDLRNGISQACKDSERYFLKVKPKFDVELDDSVEKLLAEKRKAKPDTSVYFRVECPRQIFIFTGTQRPWWFEKKVYVLSFIFGLYGFWEFAVMRRKRNMTIHYLKKVAISGKEPSESDGMIHAVEFEPHIEKTVLKSKDIMFELFVTGLSIICIIFSFVNVGLSIYY